MNNDYNEDKLLAKYKAGMKGGPFFASFPRIQRTIVNGYPAESIKKVGGSPIRTLPIKQTKF